MQLLCWAVTFRCMLTDGPYFVNLIMIQSMRCSQKTLPGNCNLLFSHSFCETQAFTGMMNMRIRHMPLEGGAWLLKRRSHCDFWIVPLPYPPNVSSLLPTCYSRNTMAQHRAYLRTVRQSKSRNLQWRFFIQWGWSGQLWQKIFSTSCQALSLYHTFTLSNHHTFTLSSFHVCTLSHYQTFTLWSGQLWQKIFSASCQEGHQHGA